MLMCASVMLIIAISAAAVARDPIEVSSAPHAVPYAFGPNVGYRKDFELEVPINVERALIRQAIHETPARKRMQYAQLTVYDVNGSAPSDFSGLFPLRNIEQ
jgi:hypothetical protein